MNKNNKGFIAISLIYSFFLVFLATLLMIAVSYAHNRVLLSDVKKETQNYLNSLAEFNPVKLEFKKDASGNPINYTGGDTVFVAAEQWKVLEDDGTNVKLLLNRSLTAEEITNALSSISLPNVQIGNTIPMCFNTYKPLYCSYESNGVYNEYRWGQSIVKAIVENWLTNNAILQKGIDTGNIIKQNFSDGKVNYSSYIRIPMAGENAGTDIWYLTYGRQENGISYINIGGSDISLHNTYKNIKPVILVKKSS